VKPIFALGMERRLSRGLRSFPRRLSYTRFPPIAAAPYRARNQVHRPFGTITIRSVLTTLDTKQKFKRGESADKRREFVVFLFPPAAAAPLLLGGALRCRHGSDRIRQRVGGQGGVDGKASRPEDASAVPAAGEMDAKALQS
jgi:hypothetical protein